MTRAAELRARADRLEVIESDLEALLEARLVLEDTEVSCRFAENALESAIIEIETAEQELEELKTELEWER